MTRKEMIDILGRAEGGSLPRIFEAALSGFIANPDFHGPIHQGNPKAAVDFAIDVCVETWRAPDAPA